MHVEKQSADPQNKSTCSHVIHHTSSLTVAQRTEQKRLSIMHMHNLRDKYNSSLLTKHT